MGFMPVAPRAQEAVPLLLAPELFTSIFPYTVYLINVDACVTFRLIIFKCIWIRARICIV